MAAQGGARKASTVAYGCLENKRWVSRRLLRQCRLKPVMLLGLFLPLLQFARKPLGLRDQFRSLDKEVGQFALDLLGLRDQVLA